MDVESEKAVEELETAIFERLQLYDFDNDAKFQIGLEKISSLPSHIGGQRAETDLHKIKAFYYSR